MHIQRRTMLCSSAALLASRPMGNLATTAKHLATAGAAITSGAFSTASSAQSADAPVFQGRNGWLFPVWENLTTVDTRGIQTSIQLFERAQTLFQSVGTRLVFVVVPIKALVQEKYLPDERPISATVRDRYGLIQRALQRNGLLSVDVLSVLRELENRGESAYYRTDYHWTSPASEATADATATVISGHTAIARSPGTVPPLGEWVNERHYGDLAARYLSPIARVKLGKDLFRVRLDANSEGSLLDEDASPVHVMGNSFVQPYWGFSQRLAHQLQATTSLTWNPGTIGHWAIALRHAKTQLQGLAKPRGLVWQMNEAQLHVGPDTDGLFDRAGLMPPEEWLSQLKTALNA